MALTNEELDRGVRGLELAQLSHDFRRALLRQERSLSTIRTYEWALRDFRRFLLSLGVTDSEQLRREMVDAWQDHSRERVGRSTRSIISTAVRQFLRWGVGYGYFDPRAPYWVTHVKGRRGKPRPIPIEDLRVILRYLQRRRLIGSIVHLRNWALFLFILDTGARVSEALQLTRAEIQHAIVRQKGGGDKEFDASPIVIEALEAYLGERTDNLPWVWVTLDNNHPMRPLQPAGVREIWRRLALQLHIQPWTTHQIRHTGATELHEADIDGLVIADWLGHKGMGHAMQYTGISPRRRRQALDVLQRLIERNSGLTQQG